MFDASSRPNRRPRAPPCAGRFEFDRAADARRQYHVRCRTMADPEPVTAEDRDLALVEVDPMREQVRGPSQPRTLEELDGPAAIPVLAERCFVLGLGQMGMERAVETLASAAVSRIRCSVTVKGEQGARPIWMSRQASGRGTATGPARCRAGSCPRPEPPCRAAARRPSATGSSTARHRHADADLARGLDLEIDRLFEPLRVEVVVVGRGRATRHQEFDQGDPHGRAQRIGGQPRPDRVEGLQQGKSRLLMAAGWARVSVW